MEAEIFNLKKIRESYIDLVNQYSLEQLLYIPVGFRNNIFWNVAHILATQQLLHYYLTDNRTLVSMEFINTFKKGTVGNNFAAEEDVKELVELLEETPTVLLKDYNNEKLNRYRPFTTALGIQLNNIEDAITFNNLHESIHLGYILALKNSIPF